MSNIINSVETDAIAREGAEVLKAELAKLKPIDRAIVMGYALDKTYADIGDEIGISKQAVEKRHKRALDVIWRRMATVGYRSVADFGIAA